MFDTFHDNSALLKMKRFKFHTDESIEFFLDINPKLILRKLLKETIDEICTWLDLDDDDTNTFVKETT